MSALVWYLELDALPNASHFTVCPGCLSFMAAEFTMQFLKLRSPSTKWSYRRMRGSLVVGYARLKREKRSQSRIEFLLQKNYIVTHIIEERLGMIRIFMCACTHIPKYICMSLSVFV